MTESTKAEAETPDTSTDASDRDVSSPARQEVEPQTQKHAGPNSIVHGLVVGVALHAAGAAISSVTTGFTTLLFIGLLQLIYLGPAMMIYGTQRRTETVKGIAIVLAITFLINAACFGLVMGSLSGGSLH